MMLENFESQGKASVGQNDKTEQCLDASSANLEQVTNTSDPKLEDRRENQKCLECSRRKVKCSGQLPCAECSRSKCGQ